MKNQDISEQAYRNGYEAGKAEALEQARQKVIGELKDGTIPIKDGTVWVLVPNQNIFTAQQRRFFKTATPVQLYAKLGQISATYAEQVVAQLEQARQEEQTEQVEWDHIMEIIRSVSGVGEVLGNKIDSAVRKEFD